MLNEFDRVRHLVRGHVLARPHNQFFFRGGLPGAQYRNHFDALATLRIAEPNHARFLYGWMRVQQTFDFGGPYFVAGRIDHAFEAINQKEITFVIDIGQVARAEITYTFDLDKRRFGGIGLSPVALEYLRSMQQNFADFVICQYL